MFALLTSAGLVRQSTLIQDAQNSILLMINANMVMFALLTSAGLVRNSTLRKIAKLSILMLINANMVEFALLTSAGLVRNSTLIQDAKLSILMLINANMVEFAPHHLMLINANMVVSQQIKLNAPTHFALVKNGLVATLALTLLTQQPAGLKLTLLKIANGVLKDALLISAKIMKSLTKLQPHQQKLKLEQHGASSTGPKHALTPKFKT
jgi:hypothetical protein